jgi:hypothetical protein
MALNNPVFDEHMVELFGNERAGKLRLRLTSLQKPYEKQDAIIEEMTEALNEMGGSYVLPFCFMNDQGSRTSHHLIFVSKNPLGNKIMKDIMARSSSIKDQGVGLFRYCPADERFPLLFELSKPLDDLYSVLLEDFKGLLKLEEDHKIIVESKGKRRTKGTFSDGLIVTFPSR